MILVEGYVVLQLGTRRRFQNERLQTSIYQKTPAEAKESFPEIPISGLFLLRRAKTGTGFVVPAFVAVEDRRRGELTCPM